MSYRDEVIVDRPVRYYRHGERSGTTAVDEMAASNGTISGGVTLGHASLLVSDPANTSFLFDGTSGTVTVADDASLDLGDGPWTLEAWVLPTAFGSLRTVLDKGVGSWIWRFLSDGRLLLRHNGRTNVSTTTTALPLDGVAHIIALSDGRQYVNGVLASGSVTATTFGNTTNPVTIGSAQRTDFFRGVIDEVAVYNTVLSEARIRAHTDAGFNPADTTAPIVTLASIGATRISTVSGRDTTTFTVTADEAFVEYEIRSVPGESSPHTSGSLVEGGVVASTRSQDVTVTDDELVATGAGEGTYVIKAFVADAAGNWST